MQFDAGLTGDAAALARAHQAALDAVPATVAAFILVELQKWASLFAAEQRYQRALLEQLSGLSKPDLSRITAGIARVETAAGCDRIARGNPGRFQDDAQALLRKRQLLTAWRKEIDAFFATIDPALDARLFPPDAPRRLVVQLYGSGIAVQPDKLWSRFGRTGIRVPLDLSGSPGLRNVSAGAVRSWRRRQHAAAGARVRSRATRQLGHRVARHPAPALRRGGAASRSRRRSAVAVDRGLVGLSYERLREYRDQLTRALYSKIESGVESPQAFAAYARSLKIAPGPDALLHPDSILQGFVRDVLLTGNGTLFVNNTFVEWAAVQALRRAQPRLLVTRFGVRDKLKPFSSLLLFSQPRAADQIPLVEDPVGSFVDVEQLSYYVWLNAEKSPAYRRKTLYLFLAEGIDEMLAVRSDELDAPAPAAARASLADVCATMTHWLGLPIHPSSGRPISTLVG